MEQEQKLEQDIRTLIESTKNVCNKIKAIESAENHNSEELSNITDRILKILSSDNENNGENPENLITKFLMENENYCNYFYQLLNSVKDIYNLEISIFKPVFSTNVNGKEYETQNASPEIIAILEAESVSLMDNLLENEPYKDLNIEFDKNKSFKERIENITQLATSINSSTGGTEDKNEQDKKLLIKSFYIDLCIQLQNFISPFIGKTFKKKITNSENEEPSTQASGENDKIPQGADENKAEYKNLSVNCSDSGLNYIFEQMKMLKEAVSKFDDGIKKSTQDFNLMDILSKTENSNEYKIQSQTEFEKYYFIDNAKIIRRKPGYRGVIPKLSYEDPDKETIKIIYDLENDLPELKTEKLVKCPVKNYPKCINKEKAVSIIEDVYHFSYDEDSSTEGNPVWHGTEIANAVIMFENDKGWSYQIGGESVEEFDVAERYADQKSTSTGVGKAFMNGHHGIPSEWAIAEAHCGKEYYNPDDAPVIMLRDTMDGSTHRFITTLQNMWDKFNDMKTEKWDYSEIRRVAMEQLYIVAEIVCTPPEGEKNLISYSISDSKKSNSTEPNSILVDVKQKTTDDKKNTPEKLQLSYGDVEKKKKMYIDKIEGYFKAADKYYKGIYEEMLKSDPDARKRAITVFSSYRPFN